MKLTMDRHPHDWHVHLSFAPRRKYSWLTLCADHHRTSAKQYRGDHGMVKAHRDAMRHFAKREARSL
jgi:hypothetical protein